MLQKKSSKLLSFILASAMLICVSGGISNSRSASADTVISTIDLHNFDIGFYPDQEVQYLAETDDEDKVEIAAEWWKDSSGVEVASIDHQLGIHTDFKPTPGVYYYGVRFEAKDEYEFSEETKIYGGGEELSSGVEKITVSSDRKYITFDMICEKPLTDSSSGHKIDVKSLKLSKEKYVYDGKAHKPTVSAKMVDGSSVDGFMIFDYGNSNPVDVGFYSVSVTPDNTAIFSDGDALKSLVYYIIPKSTSIKSLSASKKALTVKWKKQATQTTGYIVQLSKDKSFKKIAKTKTIKKTGTTSAKFSGLKSKTKYYARVCAYKHVASSNIQSAWSSVKNKKAK